MQNLAACQRPGGAFLRSGEGTVLSCVPTPAPVADAKAPAKKPKEKAPAASSSSSSTSAAPVGPTFDVQLSDTVLFPEGGGQPSDTGVLTFGSEQVQVLQVLRTPNGIVHRVNKELPVNTPVSISIDWSRRFDHMQCHSTQHLISAIARSRFNLKTVSWWLSSYPQECHIEMDGIITQEQMNSIEADCNELIRKAVDLKLHTYESLATAKSDEVFTSKIQKSIPEDHDGAIRVIEIEGLDFNPCCGTHLTNTAQMQLIKLTRFEKSKTSSKVFFYTGERSINALTQALDVQRGLNTLLSCPADGFVDKVKQLQTESRAQFKTLTNVLKALAQGDGEQLVAQITAGAKVAHLHRDEVGLGFLSDVADIVCEGLKKAGHATPYVLFASTSDVVNGPAGAFLLVGDEAKVTALGGELSVKLTGKGGGRKGKFQGKATGMDEKKRAEAIEWLKTQM